MVRGKVQLKRIENVTNRQVTFTKRRNGLLKKAYELSLLCDADIALVIFSHKGKLFDFSTSSNIEKTIKRYQEYTKDKKQDETNRPDIDHYHHIQLLKAESTQMVETIQFLESSHRKLLGQSIDSCSLDELKEMDAQVNESLQKIRTRKEQLFKDQLEQLKQKERKLAEENARLLSVKHGMKKPWEKRDKEVAAISDHDSSQNSEVVTELCLLSRLVHTNQPMI